MIIRDTLTSNRTYYVSTTGNDSNTGLDAANAFLTIQKAIDVVSNTIDNMGYAVTIQVADGAYNAPLTLKAYVGSGLVTLQGNTSTPSNVTITISTSGANCIAATNGSHTWAVSGFKLSTTGSASHSLLVLSSSLTFATLDFGASAGNHIVADRNSTVVASGSYAISGGAGAHVISYDSTVDLRNRTVTITGTPAFSSSFAAANLCGVLQAESMTFSGSATGPRYSVASNSVISCGGGANYFPGNSAGSTFTGGQYI
jgi:hypothetical protein